MARTVDTTNVTPSLLYSALPHDHTSSGTVLSGLAPPSLCRGPVLDNQATGRRAVSSVGRKYPCTSSHHILDPCFSSINHNPSACWMSSALPMLNRHPDEHEWVSYQYLRRSKSFRPSNPAPSLPNFSIRRRTKAAYREGTTCRRLS